jgi:hypothetical protein
MLFSCCVGHCPYVKRSVVKTYRVEFHISPVNQNDACFCLSGAVDLTLAGRMKEITPMPTWRQEQAALIKQSTSLCTGAIHECKCGWKRLQFSRVCVQVYCIHFRVLINESFMGGRISDWWHGNIVTTHSLRISDRIPELHNSAENF